ncbi:MAG: hypothetical protein M1823_002663 [Watsoniomyces obsoletus]|nr:MAG: hypothetical protein M1823_002663 [Watsoniomyces obsoletus]
MVLEATMIIVDNSESSRNGDYPPSRFEAQADAMSLLFSAKTQANPESSVGLMSMGGKGPEVLVTLTTDFGKILEGLHRTKIRGGTHLATGIQIAGLALKHRQNKAQRQRIIVFCCSPIEEDEKTLVRLAKKMKKNNVSIDFIAFGELEGENTKKLEAFNENVKGGEGSHLAIIPPGPHLLSDVLLTTPILGGDGGASGAGAAGAGADGAEAGGSGFEFGVDPSMEPELALALRMSFEEEQARREKERREQEAAEGKTNLEGIPEEGSSKPPEGDKKEEGGDSGEGSGSKESTTKDEDKMDTA